jgi:SPP1 family predicted phage head-tail adaptor
MRLPTIGELRQRLRLESAARAGDGGGGADVTWTLVAEVWARVTAAGGGEPLRAEMLDGRVMHEVWIRHRDGVVPAMRFVQGARVYDIRAVQDPDGRRRWLRCLCEEHVG